MRTPRTFAVSIVLLLGLTACGDASDAAVTTTTTTTPSTTTTTTTVPASSTTTRPPVVRLGDLEGSWTASSHLFTDAADPGRQFDLIANGGETRFTVLPDGRTRIWVEIGPTSDEWDALLTLSSGTLTLTPAEASRPTLTFSITLVGDTLTLTREDSSFDFSLTDAPQTPAIETITLMRS